MNRPLKWILVAGGSLVVLVIGALLVIPMFVDIQKYKPVIESTVAERTGRSFSIGGDLRLFLFPRAGVTFSNLILGNTKGFDDQPFVTIRSFEVRLKPLALLFGDVKIEKFALDGPHVRLLTRKGRVNWTLETAANTAVAEPPGHEATAPPEAGKSDTALPIRSLTVDSFDITDGRVLWVDQDAGVEKSVSDITLQMTALSLDRPIGISLSALLDQLRFDLTGSVGPLGSRPAAGPIPLDLAVNLTDELSVRIEGRLENLGKRPAFDLDLISDTFSPRKLLAAMGATMAPNTADKEVLKAASVACHLKGTSRAVTLSKGRATLDDSQLAFSAKAGPFSFPEILADLSIDQLDLDRYLPPAALPEDGGPSRKRSPPAVEKSTGEMKAAAADEEVSAAEAVSRRPDYAFLRSTVIDASVDVGRLKVKNAHLENVSLKIDGKKGRFHIDPLKLDFYEGTLDLKGDLDFRKAVPKTGLSLKVAGLQINPLLRDVVSKDFLEGVAEADIDLRMQGDRPVALKRSLDGKGTLTFNDGAIVGIDIAGMVRNIKAAFAGTTLSGTGPRTDFTELRVPFTITGGVLKTDGTRMQSPVLRLTAAGTADLAKEVLDVRLEPKFVATLKGQGDSEERSGFAVPVLVSGDFLRPTFRPDLKSLLRKGIAGELPRIEDLKKALPDSESLKQQKEALKEAAKTLLKDFKIGD